VKHPVERRQALEAAGTGNLGDRPLRRLAEQPAGQADALRVSNRISDNQILAVSGVRRT
jgi:hypothetical protein